jgi:hypothetical protein
MKKTFLLRPSSLFTFSLLLGMPNAFSQDVSEKENQLSVSLQIKPRIEYRDGSFQPLSSGAKPAAFTSQRNRLSLTYSYRDKFSVHLAPQNVMIWGQDGHTQSANNNNGVSFFEAWANLNITRSLSVKVGRQIISLDDERFLGESDWAQGGRSHDAISISYTKNKLESKLFAAYNQNYKELYGNNMNNISGSLYSTKDAASYKWMQTWWGNYRFNKRHAVSAVVANIGFQNAKDAADSAKTYFSQTIGTNYFFNNKHWAYQLSAYYQTGDNAQGIKTNAYLLSFFANRKINNQWNATIGTDFLSGNKMTTTSAATNTAFNPYLGTNHKFYGNMDYYYAGNGHKNTGLVDLYFKTGYKPAPKWTLDLAIHQFYTSVPLKDEDKNLSSNLGQEADLSFNFIAWKNVSLSGGYSIYLTTPSVLFVKGVTQAAATQHWAWLCLNVNPKIFNHNY